MTQIKPEASNSSEDLICNGPTNKKNQKHGPVFFKKNSNNCLIKYNGTMIKDNFHGRGIYTQIKSQNNFQYEGTMYANTFEGYAQIIHGNCVYYEGLYKNNKRFGPGVVFHPDGTQDVGFWNGTDLMRLPIEVKVKHVPSLTRTPNGKIEILQHRRLIPLSSLNNETSKANDYIDNCFIRNQNSVFFNWDYYDRKCNGFDNVSSKIGSKTKVDKLNKKLKSDSTMINNALKSIVLNIKQLDACSHKELCLLQQKLIILTSIMSEQEFFQKKPHKPTSSTTQSLTSSIDDNITDLLAWNNEDYLIQVLLHAFKHRKQEYIVNYLTSNIIQNKRNVFKSPGYYETACKLFLISCSEGNDDNLVKLHKQYKINPDITDSKGNSGIIYAAVKDKIYILKRLVNFGAKLDIVNDENITALNLCFLRYLAVYRDVQDWEQAFLNIEEDIDEQEENEDYYKLWKGESLQRLATQSFLSHISTLSQVTQSITSSHLSLTSKISNEVKEDLVLHYLNDIVLEEKSLDWFFTQLEMDSKDLEHFQQEFEVIKDDAQRYLFDWSMLPAVKIKKQPKVQINVLKLSKEHSAKFENEKKLHVISNTIRILLKLGCNPNICTFPVPTIILAIHCNNTMLLEKLISKKVEVGNVYGPDELTLFHILCSLPPDSNMHKMASVLIQLTDLDFKGRCGFNHWKSEIKKIRGDVKEQDKNKDIEEVNEEGKTALHILATRIDFGGDPDGYLNHLAKTIVSSDPSTLDDLYLNHSPLSLAVLRGNVNLVNALLDVRANPNFILPNGLGNCLVIYGLKRYSKPKMLPNVQDCKKILDLLVLYGGNPLANVDDEGHNAIEYIAKDNEPDFVNKDKSKGLKDTKTKKGKESKSKASKSSKTSKKITPQNEITNYLLELSKKVILHHHNGKIAILLFKKLLEGTVNDFKHLFQFLRFEDGIKVVTIFVEGKILDLTDLAHFLLAYMFLECVRLYGVKDNKDMDNDKPKKGKNKNKGKAKKKKTSKSIKSTKSEKSSKSVKLSINEPNLQDTLNIIMQKNQPDSKKAPRFHFDQDITKYKVCFTCGLRLNKHLIACPGCGLVYFCSQKCNLADVKSTSRHPCKILYYDEELQETEDGHKTGTINNLEVTFRQLPLHIPNSDTFRKYVVFEQLLHAARIGNEEKVSNLLDLMKIKIDIKKININRLSVSFVSYTEVDCQKPTLSRVFPVSYSFINPQMVFDPTLSTEEFIEIDSKATLGLTKRNCRFIRPASSLILSSAEKVDEKPAPKFESSDFMLKSRLSSYNTEFYSEDMLHFAKSFSKQSSHTDDTITRTFSNLKWTRMSKAVPRLPSVNQELKQTSRKISKVKPKKIKTKKTPNDNQKFIKILCKLFPEYDFTDAIAPFVAYSADAQFYYKFSEQEPSFISNHM